MYEQPRVDRNAITQGLRYILNYIQALQPLISGGITVSTEQLYLLFSTLGCRLTQLLRLRHCSCNLSSGSMERLLLGIRPTEILYVPSFPSKLLHQNLGQFP